MDDENLASKLVLTQAYSESFQQQRHLLMTWGLAYSLSCLSAGVGSCAGNPAGMRGVRRSAYGPGPGAEVSRLLVICASAVVLDGGVSGRF